MRSKVSSWKLSGLYFQFHINSSLRKEYDKRRIPTSHRNLIHIIPVPYWNIVGFLNEAGIYLKMLITASRVKYEL